MVATNQHAMIELLLTALLTANRQHAQHIPDHKVVTAELAVLNNVMLVNILPMMEDAFNAHHLQSQMLEIKTEIDVFNQTAQQTQSLPQMEHAKPVQVVSTQIKEEDNVSDYNATIDKEL